MPRRLALYSDQIPPLTDPIDEAALRGVKTVGYIPSSPDPERTWFEPRREYYARYGLQIRYFGLEDEYDPAAREALLQCDAIHLTGGNTFQFLYWLRERNLMDDLRQYEGVLIGVSAGAILMTPEVSTSLRCGDVPYRGIASGAGLGLVDFLVVPHFDGSAEMVRGLQGLVYALRDGDGLIVEDGAIQEFRMNATK